jgi:hypothetical protein
MTMTNAKDVDRITSPLNFYITVAKMYTVSRFVYYRICGKINIRVGNGTFAIGTGDLTLSFVKAFT